MKIETKYDYGQIVFLIHDPDQLERMVIGINGRPTGIIYLLACGIAVTEHYELEIASETTFKLNQTNG